MANPHHRNGSEYPPLTQNLMRVYSMRYCPFAERTLLVLKHKKVPHEIININLWDKPDWFLARTPMGTVPVLEKDDKIVFDSTICNYYLDGIYPENRIVPDDPFEKAQVSMLLEQFSKFTPSFYATLRATTIEQREENFAKLQDNLKVFEKALTSTFFGGKQPGLVDFNIWPFFERFCLLDEAMDKPTVTKELYPKLSEWIQNMNDTDAVKAVRLSPEVHKTYRQAFVKGKPDYDAIAG